MALIDNLVAYYKLDESTGNAADSVGSNTGINTGVTYAASKINNGAVFSGSGSDTSFNFGDPAVLRFGTNSFTLSFWLYLNGAPASEKSLFNKDPSGTLFFSTIETDRTVRIRNILTGGTDYYSGAMTADAWHHVVILRTGSTQKIYLDGTESLSTTGTAKNIDAVGTSWTFSKSNNNYLKGGLDEVGIWSRALTSTEVTELYNSGNGKQYPFTISFIISEALALVESITNLRALKSTISETLSLSETWTALKGILFTISETITTSEIWTTARELITTVIDTLGLSELITLKKKWTNQSKSQSTWSNQSKSNTTWINKNKS